MKKGKTTKKSKEYSHGPIERKWQNVWEKKKIHNAKTTGKKKFYGLIEFPYPSGAGMHVGHIRSNTAMDIITRKRRMEGYNVLYPIGWDAFGLPTENYAIKTGIPPAKVTKQNTDTFRKQLKSLGFGFDWSREVNTTDPAYYKWTQWIFLQMYKKGLAYKKKTEINWCPSCKIGLANEEVVAGACERCGTAVVKREKEQWMLAITKYADRLDKDLDDVNYLEKIKTQQRNWIGKSEGSEIDFAIKGTNEKIKIFTTRADTIYGATYVVLAPEHKLVESLKYKVASEENKKEIEKYIKDVKKKDELERTSEDKEKTGVALRGIKATNPTSGEEVPVWVADYVLPQYGTGAVMAVPAHDSRDSAFAKKYHLPMKRVVEPLFINESGDGAVRDKLPFIKRDAVCAVVRNPKDGKYLCVSWKKFLMHGFVTGGIEEGEDAVESALREIYEETGYKNVKFIKDPEVAIHSLFYHRIKEQNRWARFRYLFFELINEEQDSIDKKESDLHDVLWKSKNELKDFFSVIEGKFVSNLLYDHEYVYTGEGVLFNSGEFTGMRTEEARLKITEKVGGKMVTKYKLRDWVFSRQRYWGEPIPLINCPKCGWVEVPEKDLPVVLPKVKSYQPTDTGESPLANISSWVNTKCPKCKGPAKRETDTMPNWAGSSWYFLRYADPKNKKEFASKKALKYFTPVDWYNGGMEHTTLHLLYSRFWHKFLYDLKLVPTKEPYMKRTSHGLILADDGTKFSKSKGNGIDPLDIVKNYGADTLRLYEMFMGPFDQAVAWNGDSLIGPRRFLERVYRLAQKIEAQKKNENSRALPSLRGLRHDVNFAKSASLEQKTSFERTLHQTIKKVSEDIENMNFNTAISSMMILLNEMEKVEFVDKKNFKLFLQILAPFAPHIADELWAQMGDPKGKSTSYGAGLTSIHLSKWPKFDPKKIIESKIKIMLQVNGKVRSEMMVGKDTDEGKIKDLAQSDPNILKWIEGKEIKKVIYVKGRLVNIVVNG